MHSLCMVNKPLKNIANTGSKLGLGKANFPDGPSRPDLSNGLLLGCLIGLVVITAAAMLAAPVAPGSGLGQSFAGLGSLLLCAPMVFVLMKRSGISKSPPMWFSVHVISSSFGLLFISVHVAQGDWLSPPGLVLAALVFLVLQGFLARVFLGKRLSYLFARSASSFNFTGSVLVDRKALQIVIENKQKLLEKLDDSASEALYSPTLKHWITRPLLSFKYQQLIAKESRLVGARARAGWLLRSWRRLHIGIALLFVVGMLAHVVVMLFFAGYAAGEEPITWWHIMALGGK